jgi:hypothetical protein
MKVKNFKSFNEGKDKFPDIRTLDIDGFIVYIGRCQIKRPFNI